VPEFQGSILLCRRAIEPRLGFWTVPAGFMELGETLGEAAIRETWEEAHARVELGPLFAVVDVVHARQVHVFFRGTMSDPEFGAGAETLEARLVRPGDLPWSGIAFPSVTIALRQYLAGGAGPVHLAAAPRLRLG
jgi:ADP-ribose pyrophosphatase YjhB (NUDIX family)